MSLASDMEYRLLQSLAEELKLPFLQIARQAEWAEPGVLESIRATADYSLKLIEGYLLSLENFHQQSLLLEPVSVSSVFYDTAHVLSDMASAYNCKIELDIAGKYGPVMADRVSLESALLLLGGGMIIASTPESENNRVVLGAHNSAQGLVAGVFQAQNSISKDMLKRGRALIGSARQVIPGAASGSGTSLFIASSLLEAMSSPLRLARHNKLSGLAATLTLSKQIRLV